MRRFGLCRAGAGVAVTWLTVAMLTMGSTGAGADTGEPIGEAQAVTLDGTFSPAEVGQLPELAGPGFVATAIHAAFYGQVSTDSGDFAPASSRDQLLFLSVNLYSFAPPVGTSDRTYKADFAPDLTVNFQSSSIELQQNPGGSIDGVAGSAYGDQGELYSGQWLVAVPKNAPVSLSATENGFTQSVDIRNASRIGEAPTVLYRSPTGPLALDFRPNLAATLVVDAGGSRVSFPVTLKEAILGFFDLSSADDTPASTPGQAYLFAQVSIGTGVDGQGRADWYLDPSTPGQAVTLAPGGGLPESAAHAPAAPGPYGVGDTGSPSGGLFGFVVPAELTSASVVVSTGPDPSVYYQGPDDYSATSVSVSSAAPATFKVSFPAASAPLVVTRPPTLASSSSSPSTPATAIHGGGTPPPTAQLDQPASESQRRSGQGWWPIGVGAGAGTAIIVVAGFFISRRTRLVEAKPVTPEEEAPLDAAPARDGGRSTNGHTSEEAVLTGGGLSAPVGSPELKSPTTLPRLRVGVLGPLVVEGTGDIRRKVVLRALIVLALFLGTPISSEELRGWLADGEYSEPSAGSLRSELSRLRRVLPEGSLPEMGTTSGYALAAEDVDVDWINFGALAVRARAAAGNDRVELGLKALGLIRGRVLEHRSWHGIDRMVWDMNVSIEALAADIATEALAAGRPADAAEAVQLGLKAVPSGRLWLLRVQAAEAGSGEDVRNVTERARSESVAGSG